MRKFFLLLMVCFASCEEGNKDGIDEPPSQHQKISQQQEELILEKAVEFPNNTQVSFAFINGDSVVFHGIKLDNDSVIVVENHHKAFEIGSITKVFTSTLLAKYVLDGKVHLEDDVTPYLDFGLIKDLGISFTQLANHTSGLPRLPSNFETESFKPENPYQSYEASHLKDYLSEEVEFLQTPGEQYLYSNLGMGILGYTLEQLEGKSYEQLIQENIITKYDMLNSTTNRAFVEDILVKGIYENGEEAPNWDLSVLVGAGGILSTTEDLSKFVFGNFDASNKDLALTRKKTFTVNHISDIGLGWEIIKRKSGDIWYKHSGGTGGYTSFLIMDVNNKKGIIILSNVSDFSSKSAIIEDWAFDLMKTLYH